jgi:hypothetical protein
LIYCQLIRSKGANFFVAENEMPVESKSVITGYHFAALRRRAFEIVISREKERPGYPGLWNRSEITAI